MLTLIRVSGMLAALAIAVPAMAQQSPTASHKTTKHAKISKSAPAEVGVQGGYMSTCGAYFRCYDRIPLDCADNTRPYQNIAAHQCLCVRDGCPQNGF
ncbi:MAG TPA: hypothetical protein VGN55_02835 [Xanthobacteraceae bacterium]